VRSLSFLGDCHFKPPVVERRSRVETRRLEILPKVEKDFSVASLPRNGNGIGPHLDGLEKMYPNSAKL
jgi:hypothetical protein